MRDKKISAKLALIGCLFLSIGSAHAQPSAVECGMVTNVEMIEIGETDKDQRNLATAT